MKPYRLALFALPFALLAVGCAAQEDVEEMSDLPVEAQSMDIVDFNNDDLADTTTRFDADEAEMRTSDTTETSSASPPIDSLKIVCCMIHENGGCLEWCRIGM